MKFEAKKIDLSLELVSLTGEIHNLEPVGIMTADRSITVVEAWTQIEKDETSVVKIIAEQLAIVYPKNAEWFLINFDAKTLSDIVKHVAQSLGGLRKNVETSN